MLKPIRLFTALVLIGIAGFSLLGHTAEAQSATLTPFFRQQFFDTTDRVVAGGTVGVFIAGTSTPTNSYTDSTGSVANPNPVVLDNAGTASIWLKAGASSW